MIPFHHSYPWKRKLRAGLLLVRRPSRRNFPIMLEQGQLAIRLSILDLSNGRSIRRREQLEEMSTTRGEVARVL